MSPITVAKSHHLVTIWLEAGKHLYRVLGDYPIGVALLEAFYSDHPEVTVEYVVARVGDRYGDDTVRRKLCAMEKLGVIACRKAGRTQFCRLKPEIAAAALAMIESQAAQIRKSST